MPKRQNRDANHLRWQKSTSLGIRVPGPEYRKMEHRETLWWGCCCKKKRENHYVSRRRHPSFKGTNPALKSRRIYPNYMPKCSVGSTNYVCNYLPKNIELCGRYQCLKFPPKKRFTWRHFRQWRKYLRFGSGLFTQFWRCKNGFVYYSNVQRTFKDGKIKSTLFTRPHAMKRHKSISPILRKMGLKF